MINCVVVVRVSKRGCQRDVQGWSQTISPLSVFCHFCRRQSLNPRFYFINLFANCIVMVWLSKVRSMVSCSISNFLLAHYLFYVFFYWWYRVNPRSLLINLYANCVFIVRVSKVLLTVNCMGMYTLLAHCTFSVFVTDTQVQLPGSSCTYQHMSTLRQLLAY